MTKANKIIIVTNKLDPHSDAVINILERRGYFVFRLNSEDLLINYSFSFNFRNETADIFIRNETNGKEINSLDEIIVGWYRKPGKIQASDKLNIESSKDYSIQEASEFLKYLYSLPNLRWVNNPFKIREGSIKNLQLSVASQLGFKIPKTLVTNVPIHALDFFDQVSENALVKPLSAKKALIDNQYYSQYSHKISKKDIRLYLDNISYAPTLFQEYIEKENELRVTVFGNSIFSCQLDTQIIPETKIDWRKVSPFDIPHKIVELPKEINNMLIKFNNHFELEFGVFDLIKTPYNEYYFLENNPNGQWYWVELITKAKMAESMANLLLSTADTV